MNDPYPTYARLRNAGPLCRGGPAQWVATRHAEVASLLRDPRLGNHFPEAYRQFSFGNTAARTFFDRIILNRDPPDHSRLRQLFGAAFSPAVARKLGEHIGHLIDNLLERVLDLGHFDAVTDLAFPLPVFVVCELIGIPAADREQVRPRATQLCRAFGTHLREEDRPAVDEALVWLREYVGQIIDERTARPREDLISAMVAAGNIGSEFAREELVDNVVFLFFAGFETAKNLISTGCAALSRYPEQFKRLRADPYLAPLAVEEFLRYDAPIQAVGRLVLAPLEIGGRLIKRGRVLVLLIGSANHDERWFEDPEHLDIGRNPNQHLSFGGGIHFCLGATLARVEAGMAFERLCRRAAVLEPAGEAIRQPSGAFRSLASVPLLIRSY